MSTSPESKSELPQEEVLTEVLVCATGSTPQIVTEALYALAKQAPPVIIDNIIIITTKEGRKEISEHFLENKIKRLFSEYKIKKCPAMTIELLKDISGNELEDIRTTADNDAAANQIVELVKKTAEKDNERIHCVIAGGRKTMGYYLGTAMQLYGRAMDKMYHVLVSPVEFEGNPDFFYKTKDVSKIPRHDGKKGMIDAANANIELAELPFVRLGSLFFDTKSKTFPEMVKAGQLKMDNAMLPAVTVALNTPAILIGIQKIDFTATEAAIYCSYLRIKTQGCVCPKKIKCDDCYDCFKKRYINDKENTFLSVSPYDKESLIKDLSLFNTGLTISENFNEHNNKSSAMTDKIFTQAELNSLRKEEEEDSNRKLLSEGEYNNSALRKSIHGINNKIKIAIASAISDYYKLLNFKSLKRPASDGCYGILLDKNKIKIIEKS